jgi:hypothetical protein
MRTTRDQDDGPLADRNPVLFHLVSNRSPAAMATPPTLLAGIAFHLHGASDEGDRYVASTSCRTLLRPL